MGEEFKVEFFVKRNGIVNGPFSERQIESGKKNGKLTDTDLVSDSKAGPWKPLQSDQPEPTQDPVEPSANLDENIASWLDDPPIDDDPPIEKEYLNAPSVEPQSKMPKLIECEDCSREISRRAAVCPHCGCPNASSTLDDAPQPSHASETAASEETPTQGGPLDGQMVECAGCGSTVSRWAASCPHCGLPNPATTQQTESQLTIKYKPSWMLVNCKCKILVNGNLLGTGTIKKGATFSTNLLPGKHRLSVAGPLGRSYTCEVKILPGKSYSVEFVYSRTVGWFTSYKSS